MQPRLHQHTHNVLCCAVPYKKRDILLTRPRSSYVNVPPHPTRQETKLVAQSFCPIFALLTSFIKETAPFFMPLSSTRRMSPNSSPFSSSAETKQSYSRLQCSAVHCIAFNRQRRAAFNYRGRYRQRRAARCWRLKRNGMEWTPSHQQHARSI